jgi:glycosyltransferase involved in cell wall biosynthesis
MRIGIVYETTYPEFKGGVERWFFDLAKGLTEKSFQVSYLNTVGRVSTEKNLVYKEIGNSKHAFHKTGERSPKNILVFAMSVFRGVQREDFDVLYLSSFPFLHIWAARIAQKLFRRKYRIYVEWFELPNLRFWKEEFGSIIGFLGFSIQQITTRISDTNVTYLDSTYSQLCRVRKSKKPTLKLPGICMDEDKPVPTLVISGREDISQIGRLTKDKQPILGLEAIRLLKETGWEGHFHLLGSGPLELEVASYISENKMDQYVTAYGDGTEQIKNEILSKTGVLLHPSKREGFGLAIVEAAAVGIPSVLIRSQNNKSTELGINPSLVSETNNAVELASLLQLALHVQSELSSECLSWNKHVRTTMRSVESITELADHLKSI